MRMAGKLVGVNGDDATANYASFDPGIKDIVVLRR